MKNVLITGLTGFAGPHLANFLLNNNSDKTMKVYGLCRASNGRHADIMDVMLPDLYERITWLYGNLDDADSIIRICEEVHFDEVYHLAAQSHPPTSFDDPRGTFITNAQGTINLVDALMHFSPTAKMMNCSTSEVYGVVEEKDQPITEDCPLRPMNPYGVSKAMADMYVTERARNTGMKMFNTRAFSHTGPRRGKTFSISSDAYQLARIKNGLQDLVVKVGTLSSQRVVMDVRDTV